MPISFKIFALLLSVLFGIVFLSLITKKQIKPFYSFLWLIISGSMISLVVFERFYKNIATLIGIDDASFMVLIMLFVFVLFYLIHLTIKISTMSDQVQELISYTAILEYKLRRKLNDES